MLVLGTGIPIHSGPEWSMLAAQDDGARSLNLPVSFYVAKWLGGSFQYSGMPPSPQSYSSRLNPYVSSHEFHWSVSPGSERSHLSS